MTHNRGCAMLSRLSAVGAQGRGMSRDEGTGPDDVGGLLIYLHGHGSSPESVHPFFRDHLDDGWVRICPRAPLVAGDGCSWFDSGSRGVDAESLRATVDILAEVIDASAAELGVDSARIVLGGFSQGAAAAIAVSAKLDRRLGGLLIQSGFVPEVFDDEIDLTAIGAQAVLIQHGSGDEVVPVHSASDLSAMFGGVAPAGPPSQVELQITGGGHTVSDEMAAAADAWLRCIVGR